jgi:hypothetical protein
MTCFPHSKMLFINRGYQLKLSKTVKNSKNIRILSLNSMLLILKQAETTKILPNNTWLGMILTIRRMVVWFKPTIMLPLLLLDMFSHQEQ